MKRIVFAVALCTAVLALTASAATSVKGVYTTTLSGLSPKTLNGQWIVSLAPPTFAIAFKGTAVVAGTLKVSASQLTFHDVGGALACKGSQATGVYSFSLTGKTAKFKKVKDTCPGRMLVLTSRSFTKVS